MTMLKEIKATCSHGDRYLDPTSQSSLLDQQHQDHLGALKPHPGPMVSTSALSQDSSPDTHPGRGGGRGGGDSNIFLDDLENCLDSKANKMKCYLTLKS